MGIWAEERFTGWLALPLFIAGFVTGCSEPSWESYPAPTAPVGLEIDPGDADSIRVFEEGPFNAMDATIDVRELSLLHGKLTRAGSKTPSLVPLQICGARKGGPRPQQTAAVEQLLASEAEFYDTIRSAVYEEYERAYPAYKEGLTIGQALYGGSSNLNQFLPPIVNGDELDTRVEIISVYIHPPAQDGSVRIGIEFSWPWDEENGCGLCLLDGKVVTIGTAHEAYSF